MIYYNIIDNKKVFFESDIIFASYEATLANEAEREEYFLEKAKNEKQKELDNYYNNNECWTFKVFTNDANPSILKGTYASLTRDADFFAKLLPAARGKTIQIFNDKNQIIEYSLSIEKADNLNYKINISNGTSLKAKKINLENQILLAKDITSVNNINIANELQNAVLREINLDTI
jgi:hypothetical protein